MKIVVYINSLSDDYGDTDLRLVRCFEDVAAENSKDQFTIMASTATINRIKQSIPTLKVPRFNSALLFLLWHRYRLPRLLKRLGTEMFITTSGMAVEADWLKQCLIINDLMHLSRPSLKGAGKDSLKRKLTASLGNHPVLTWTPAVAEQLKSIAAAEAPVAHMPFPQQPPAAPQYIDIDEVREHYTMGRPFFLYCGALTDEANLHTLLKAFSLFKKRMKSEWQIVLATGVDKPDNKFTRSIASYRYRDDLVLVERASDAVLTELMQAAFVMIQPSATGQYQPVHVAALAAGLPVVVHTTAAITEGAEAAIMRADMTDSKELANQLMHLYKDETLHARMVAASAGLFSNENGARVFWKKINQLLE